MTGIWSSCNPVDISFGSGCRARLLEYLEGEKALIVASKRAVQQLQADPYLSSIMGSDQVLWDNSVMANPDLVHLSHRIRKFAQKKITLVVGIGGGSAIDSAKAMAVGIAAVNAGYSLAELIEQPDLMANISCLPMIAVPTTFGTGSEVTPFATVWDHAGKKKLSLAADNVFPARALIDPDLGRSAPYEVILSTGLDACNQALESIWNLNATPITMLFAAQAVELVLSALPAVLERGSRPHVDELALASLLAGLSISQTKTALCHSISYPITAHFNVPHGLACAYTMAAVCRLNQRADDGRLSGLAGKLGGDQLDVVLDDFARRFKIRERVAGYVGDLSELLNYTGEMFTPNRAGNNLVHAGAPEICAVLRDAGDLDHSLILS